MSEVGLNGAGLVTLHPAAFGVDRVVPPPGPARLFGMAVAGLLGGGLAAFALVLGVVFAVAARNAFVQAAGVQAAGVQAAGVQAAGVQGGGPAEWPMPDGLAASVFAVVAFAAVIVPLSLRQGRRVGLGDVAAGLGLRPMVRRAWIAVLAGLLLVVLAGFVAAVALVPELSRVLAKLAAEAQQGMAGAHWAVLAGYCVAVVVVAPVSEELFFRGWLWEGLRRHWGVWPTAALTAGLFTLAHATTSLYKPLMVLPLAVLLSVARHVGGSVRASLALHALNNGVAAGMVLLSRMV